MTKVPDKPPSLIHSGLLLRSPEGAFLHEPPPKWGGRWKVLSAVTLQLVAPPRPPWEMNCPIPWTIQQELIFFLVRLAFMEHWDSEGGSTAGLDYVFLMFSFCFCCHLWGCLLLFNIIVDFTLCCYILCSHILFLCTSDIFMTAASGVFAILLLRFIATALFNVVLSYLGHPGQWWERQGDNKIKFGPPLRML